MKDSSLQRLLEYESNVIRGSNSVFIDIMMKGMILRKVKNLNFEGINFLHSLLRGSGLSLLFRVVRGNVTEVFYQSYSHSSGKLPRAQTTKLLRRCGQVINWILLLITGYC